MSVLKVLALDGVHLGNLKVTWEVGEDTAGVGVVVY